MLEVDVIGSSDLPEESLRRLVAIALASAGVDEGDGHVAAQPGAGQGKLGGAPQGRVVGADELDVAQARRLADRSSGAALWACSS